MIADRCSESLCIRLRVNGRRCSIISYCNKLFGINIRLSGKRKSFFMQITNALNLSCGTPNEAALNMFCFTTYPALSRRTLASIKYAQYLCEHLRNVFHNYAIGVKLHSYGVNETIRLFHNLLSTMLSMRRKSLTWSASMRPRTFLLKLSSFFRNLFSVVLLLVRVLTSVAHRKLSDIFS